MNWCTEPPTFGGLLFHDHPLLELHLNNHYILHWYYFNGRCWLSILEDKYKPKDEPKTNMFHFFKSVQK